MALSLDPQIADALQKLITEMGNAKPPAPRDWKARRETGAAMFAAWAALQPVPADVETRDFTTRSHDGAEIMLRWFQKRGAQSGSATLYVHGGGMIIGSVASYDAIIKRYVSASAVPALAVDYRLPPEHPHPTPVEDCYAALEWLAERARSLGVDPSRIAIMGDSAGGGLAAATTLVARDRRGPVLAKQILIYPMLDDRNTTPAAELLPFLTWTYEDNAIGWDALLAGNAGNAGSADVPSYAAPTRAGDLTNLPSAYVEVGQLDIFCEETIAYALRLAQHRIATELHVHPGANHGFELFAPGADVSRRAIADRVRALKSF